MKNNVFFGFVAVIFIMTLLTIVWLGEIKKSNKTVLELIEQFDTKISNAHTMHDAIRQRQVILLSMLITEDPFNKDDMLQEFDHFAFKYREARKILHELPMNDEEKNIHKELDELANRARPVNNQAAEMIQTGVPYQEVITVINEARKLQSELLVHLDKFAELQKSQDAVAVNYIRKSFDNSVYWISFFGIIFFVITLLIGRYVSSSVARKNDQLVKAGEDMAIAYKKAEEATIIKSEFLATMSHEIRTPLTAIIGFAETTLFKDQTDVQKENAIQVIIRSSKHMLHIINEILDMSKVEANKLEIEKVDVSPFELLADVERLVKPAADEKGLGFSINYIFPLPKIVKSDPLRFKQVLINLCNNAIKFTEKGYVLINVSYSCQDDGSQLAMEVVDSGIGIKNEDLGKIFQAYHQADSSTTRQYGGTGLGLSLSRKLAEKLNGFLTVKSKVNEGSQFLFIHNIEPLTDDNLAYDKKHLDEYNELKTTGIPENTISGNVLLAEDNKDNQELLSIYLKRIGINPTVVSNGKLAVNAALENDFDLILMDLRMPVMGGLEAVELLRSSGYKKTIVALTANALKEDRDKCYKAGCDDFLTKPVDVSQLTETLKKHLDINNPDTDILSSELLENVPNAIALVTRFLNRLTDTIKNIEKHIAEESWEELSDILHQLKGTGGNFGFPKLAELASEMESYAKSESGAELEQQLLELKEMHQQMLSRLK